MGLCILWNIQCSQKSSDKTLHMRLCVQHEHRWWVLAYCEIYSALKRALKKLYTRGYEYNTSTDDTFVQSWMMCSCNRDFNKVLPEEIIGGPRFIANCGRTQQFAFPLEYWFDPEHVAKVHLSLDAGNNAFPLYKTFFLWIFLLDMRVCRFRRRTRALCITFFHLLTGHACVRVQIAKENQGPLVSKLRWLFIHILPGHACVRGCLCADSGGVPRPSHGWAYGGDRKSVV